MTDRPHIRALNYIASIDDPIRVTDESGNPHLHYSAQHVKTAFLAGCASISPKPPAGGDAGAVGLAALIEPWKNHHGPLPDYDSPIACVFDAGVQYAVELLAKELGVTAWTPCDGTEDYDGDLGGTLMNIVCEAMPLDRDGERMRPSDVCAALALPAPVVEGDARERLKTAMVDAARARGGAGASFIANGQTNLWLEIAYDAFAALSEGRSHG